MPNSRSRIAPRLSILAALSVLGLGALASPAASGQDWFPPRHVSAAAPNLTLLPGALRSFDLYIRAHGKPANVRWTAIAGPTTGSTFTPILGSTTGTVSLAADQWTTVPISVTVPGAAPNQSTGTITFRLTFEPNGGRATLDLITMIRAATGGQPELYPLPTASLLPAGAPASVIFRLKATSGTSDSYNLTVLRSNPDDNNTNNLFPYNLPASPVALPGNGTTDFSVPFYLPGTVYPGNMNSVAVSATSVSNASQPASDARGNLVASTADPDSVPKAFIPIGTVRQPFASHPLTGRDGPASVPGRNLILQSSGLYGVSVVRDSALDQMGPLDRDFNGLDDRQVGLIRPPTYSASMTIVPGFENSALEVLDLGLLSAGRGGLQLVDLRDLVDFPGQLWEEWHDFDGDGIDDRILRRLPIAGFVTDAEWFRTPEGRTVALVAAADTGSAPTTVGYNPALTVAGTGAGVVAIDLLAALDSLPGVPFIAGTLPTPGTVLDLELRGGPNPVLAIADGNQGVSFYTVAASGSPATVTFNPLGTVTLSNAWGSPYARDLAWVHEHAESLYLAVAAGASGLQMIKVPPVGSPFLALVQRTESPAIGVATAPFGYAAVALGTTGASLLKLPSLSELQQIDPLGAPPYHAPVILDLGASWTEGRPLRTGIHGAYSSSILSLRFRPIGGGTMAPDLLCADGARTLQLRTGLGGVLAVGDLPSVSSGIRLMVTPNPTRGITEFRLEGEGLRAGAPSAWEAVELSVIDPQGRVVRRLRSPAPSPSAPLWRIAWDGKDQEGRLATPGRYFVRAVQPSGWTARGGFVLLR